MRLRWVVLVGASFGGFIAQIEAYSFADPDDLVVMSWADQGFSTFAELTFTQTLSRCATGLAGLPKPHQDSYAYFGQTASDYQHAFSYQADPAVVRLSFAARPRDSCGEEGSLAQGVLTDLLDLPRIHAPVMLMYGDHDALFPALARNRNAVSLSLVRWLTSEHL